MSAAVAVGGGLVASAVFSQSAQAASAPAQHDSSTPIKASLSLTQVVGKHVAKPVSAPMALSQIRDAVAVQPQMTAVVAKSYVAPVKPAVATVAATSTRAKTNVTSRSRDRVATVPTRTAPAAPAPTTPAPVSSAPAATGGVISIAKRYIGVPYVYGGSTPSGFDCSGFTSYVYAQLGINLVHRAASQQSTVRSVSNPQPGDLVFFGTPAYHVGIYLGNGMMIDEDHPGGSVAIRPLYSGVSGYGRP